MPPVARLGQKAATEAGRGPWSAPGPAATWWHGDGSPIADAQPGPAPAAEQEPAPEPGREVAAEPEPEPAAPEPEPEPAAPEPEPECEPEVAVAVEPAALEPAVVVAALEPAPIRRALPQRVVPDPPAPEDEPAFWIPSERVPRDGGWRGPLPKPPRRPALALPGLIVFSLLAAFFAWVSAEPLWLATGHGDRGTATVTRCTGNGVGQRCVGAFATTDGRFTAQPVTLLGVAEHERHEGAAITARMVRQDSRQAYVGDDSLTLHLRWGLGLLLVLLCGVGIAWATGATRLETRRARRLAVLTSVAGPLLLAAGFVAATWAG